MGNRKVKGSQFPLVMCHLSKTTELRGPTTLTELSGSPSVESFGIPNPNNLAREHQF